MPDKSAKGIDRRDLIMASIATVGGAAAVAVNATAVMPRTRRHPLTIRHQERSIPAMLSETKRSSARSTSTSWSPARSTFCIFRA